jgi:branched-chain amino acid aminotransferase
MEGPPPQTGTRDEPRKAGSWKWWNGNWTQDEVYVHSSDLTVLRGFGAFDFLRTYNRKPFYLEEHIDRFFNTAKLMRITIPASREQIKEIIEEGIERNDLPDYYIKLICTGGTAVDTKGLSPGKSSLFILFLRTSEYPVEHYTHGIKVITSFHERYLPKAKSLAYMAAVVTLQEAVEKGADDVLYVDRNGNFLEGSTWNFFGVMDGAIVCAPEEKVLTGITTLFVREAAQQLGIPIIERENFHVSEIDKLTEAFGTSTTKGVMPIREIDGKQVGTGTAGPVAKKLIEKLEQKINSL